MNGNLPKSLVMQSSVPKFDSLRIPHGYLADDPGCDALWYYVILTKMAIAEKNDTIQYEGDEWKKLLENNRQLFKSIAIAYGVEPERMEKFWSNVDMQCVAMGSPKIPSQFRYDKIPEIGGQKNAVHKN